MRRFITSLSEQQIRHGYSLLALMEHLDRELDLLNQRRLSAGLGSAEGKRLGSIKRSHLNKIRDCISELETSGFNAWLMERRSA
ncbi:MAG: hypothetical protein ACJ0G7_09545 [Parasynechococcus sp.]|uniref:hypothetical protein n=1 Tax=Parasynechococcus sp. TaxID=3101203 RepID=UPI003884A488